MKKTIVAAVGLLVGGVLCVGYARYGPLYVTEPLSSSLSIHKETPQTFPFSVDRSDEYRVEVYANDTIPKNILEDMMGSYAGGQGRLELNWQVVRAGKPVAQGSTREFGYSPIFRSGYTGIEIGKFRAERNTQYSLVVNIDRRDPSWEPYKARIKIALHPFKLEYLALFRIAGYLLILASCMLGAVIIGRIAVGYVK
jgi:hypothetical protein